MTTMLLQPLSRIYYDPDDPEAAKEAEKHERLVSDFKESIDAVRRELDGAPGDVVDRQIARHLEGDTRKRQIAYPLKGIEEAERTKAAVAERVGQLKSPPVLFRGQDDDSSAAEKEIRQYMRNMDPIERPAAVRALFDHGDVAGMRAVLHDPLATLAGPLIEPDELDEIVEEYSRRQYPDAWERVDNQAARASRQEMMATMTLEAMERIAGRPLRDESTDPIPFTG